MKEDFEYLAAVCGIWFPLRAQAVGKIDRIEKQADKTEELALAESKRQLDVAAVKDAANIQARATIFGASTLGSRVYLFSFSSPFPWRESLPP
jgi:hypothetical protein